MIYILTKTNQNRFILVWRSLVWHFNWDTKFILGTLNKVVIINNVIQLPGILLLLAKTIYTLQRIIKIAIPCQNSKTIIRGFLNFYLNNIEYKLRICTKHLSGLELQHWIILDWIV